MILTYAHLLFDILRRLLIDYLKLNNMMFLCKIENLYSPYSGSIIYKIYVYVYITLLLML